MRILFVCLGNICRSPMAEGVFRARAAAAGLLDGLEIESVGTGSWHVGSPPDRRAQAAMAAREIDISGLRGRQVKPADFEYYDLILAMDRENLADLKARAPKSQQHKLKLFLDYADGVAQREVPDPYFGGEAGFQQAYRLIDAAATGLLAEIERQGK